MGATQAADRQRRGFADGLSKPAVAAGERAWVLERIAAKPDLTLRGMQAELLARGIRVSCKAIWNFLRAEKLTFKKKPARRRAGSAGRGAPAGTMEEVPGPD